MDDVRPDRPAGLRRGGDGAQAADFQFSSQLEERPVAGGVGPVGPGDQRAALRVDCDGADLATLVVDGPDVAVAERRPVRRAAGASLLAHALDDLVGQVARVELGDGAHDPVQQHAAGRLVDVLGSRHQRHPGLLQCQVDLDVVDAVAGQPVDLVDDDEGDRVFQDVRQHPL
nr:hypothetical protein [Blastococcus colisei]